MKELQVENGNYTRIVNKVIEELIKIPFKGKELNVCLFVIRKTWGYQKKQDAISLTQFEKALNLSRVSIIKALKNLQLVKLVILVSKGYSKKSANIYKFNKYFDTWELVKLPKLVKGKRSTSKDGYISTSKDGYTHKRKKEKTKESIAETSSAIFSFKDKLEKMKIDKDKRMSIIATYWEYKDIVFQNKEQYSAGIKRELRASKNIIGYSLEKIKSIMYWLNGTNIDWTLETTHKYIDKDIKKLNKQYEKF